MSLTKGQVIALINALGGGGGGGTPSQYLKTITKNTTDKTITIKDKQGNETTFEYGGGAELPFLSCERLGAYLYKITFDSIPDYVPADNFAIGACSTFVRDGKMHRSFDLTYDEGAEFWVKTKDFEGIARIDGVDDGNLNFDLLGQTPYCLADGVNTSGIMVSEHVLYNDFGFAGTGDKSNDMTLLPYTILTKAKSINDLNTNAEISDFLANMNIPPALAEKGYTLHWLVSDGSITFNITPKADGSAYELVDISTLPKITNFKWLNKANLRRNDSDIQTHPTGVERWNEIGANTTLADLRFTKCYESTARLSEFIGESGTTKDSTDAELEAIYDIAHQQYLTRTRNGATWQSVHAAIYGASGIESLFVQENYEHDFIEQGGETKDYTKEIQETISVIQIVTDDTTEEIDTKSMLTFGELQTVSTAEAWDLNWAFLKYADCQENIEEYLVDGTQENTLRYALQHGLPIHVECVAPVLEAYSGVTKLIIDANNHIKIRCWFATTTDTIWFNLYRVSLWCKNIQYIFPPVTYKITAGSYNSHVLAIKVDGEVLESDNYIKVEEGTHNISVELLDSAQYQLETFTINGASQTGTSVDYLVNQNITVMATAIERRNNITFTGLSALPPHEIIGEFFESDGYHTLGQITTDGQAQFILPRDAMAKFNLAGILMNKQLSTFTINGVEHKNDFSSDWRYDFNFTGVGDYTINIVVYEATRMMISDYDPTRGSLFIDGELAAPNAVLEKPKGIHNVNATAEEGTWFEGVEIYGWHYDPEQLPVDFDFQDSENWITPRFSVPTIYLSVYGSAIGKETVIGEMFNMDTGESLGEIKAGNHEFPSITNIRLDFDFSNVEPGTSPILVNGEDISGAVWGGQIQISRELHGAGTYEVIVGN